MVYVNPLVQRPLPQQPVFYLHAPKNGCQSKLANDNIDVQWTRGGIFNLDQKFKNKKICSSSSNRNRNKARNLSTDIPPKCNQSLSHPQKIFSLQTSEQLPAFEKNNDSGRPPFQRAKNLELDYGGYLAPINHRERKRFQSGVGQNGDDFYLIPTKHVTNAGLNRSFEKYYSKEEQNKTFQNFVRPHVISKRDTSPLQTRFISGCELSSINCYHDNDLLDLEQNYNLLDSFLAEETPNDSHNEQLGKGKNLKYLPRVTFCRSENQTQKNARKQNFKYSTRSIFLKGSGGKCRESESDEEYDSNIDQPFAQNFLFCDELKAPETYLVDNKQFQNYSMLALCSDGNQKKSILPPYKHLIKEGEYKTLNQDHKKLEWKFEKKDSSNSLFVSVDSSDDHRDTSDKETVELLHNGMQRNNEACQAIKNRNSIQRHRSSRERDQTRLNVLKNEYRNSMPQYDELLKKSNHISEKERIEFLRKSKALLDSDMNLYELQQKATENTFYAQSYQKPPRLKMIFSSTKSENIPNDSKPHHLRKTRHLNAQPSNSRHELSLKHRKFGVLDDYQQGNKQIVRLRKISASSFGSVSVSSIEFENKCSTKDDTTCQQNLMRSHETTPQFERNIVANCSCGRDKSKSLLQKEVKSEKDSNILTKATTNGGYFDMAKTSTKEISAAMEIV